MKTIIAPHQNIALLAKDQPFEHIAPHFILAVYNEFLRGDLIYTYKKDLSLAMAMFTDAILDGPVGREIYSSLPGVDKRTVDLWIQELVELLDVPFWLNVHLTDFLFKRVESVRIIGPNLVAIEVL